MKPKKLLFTLVTSTVVLSGGVLVACGSKDDDKKPQPGPETGVYYNYGGTGSAGRSLTLSDGNKAALALDGTNLSGTYTVKGDALKLKLKGQSDIDATLESDTITFTYNSEQLKFWKDIDYTVTYETYGGTAVSQTNVKYGATVVVPNSPTRGNDAFIGWTTVANGETLYSFDSPVTGNLTLHAKWVEATDHEFALNYNLGYDGAAQLPATKTVAGRAYNLPTPTRSGYTFKGWWVSQYDSADKLSYLCKAGETDIGTDTTLYAKWQKDGEINPDISVTESGISWERTGASVKLVVQGPAGYGNNGASEDTYGNTAAPNKAIDFTKAPAGDYEITLESGGNTYKLYYKNKAVFAVYGLNVVNNNELHFEAVDGAENYYIDIDCGTRGHNHIQIDNGSKTTYDFSACDMKPEGITFTVYASAKGKAMSVGRSVNHEAHLAAVDTSSYKLDKETGVLTWTAVENAQSYAVSINGGKTQTVNTNSVRLNNYDGEVKVKVVPQSHGYNAGEATEYKYTRTSLSTPKNLYIDGTTLKWTGDSSAKEYEIKVGTVTLKTTATEIDLNDKIEWQQDQEYEIKIRTLGDTDAKTSYWSNSTDVTYSKTTSPTPKYSASTVSWAYTLGVDYYEVQVNDGEIVKVNENSLSNIVLTKKGENTIKLRSVAEGTPNAWKTVQVNAYQIAFETGEGVAISNYYKAVGDNTNLPTPERVGYEFSHWSTAAVNGSVYDQETFTGESDITLYAAYTPRKYTVNLNYGSYGAAPDQNSATAKVEYDSDDYKLPVPTITNGKMLFIGWNTSSLGNGVVYTDYSGAAATAWKNANDGYTLYAVYVEAFSFVDDADGYTVSAGSEISKASHIVIPDTYNGKKVRSLNENAFKNCKSIVSVSIPSTVKAIPETAFDGCTNLKYYESYVSALEPDAMYYATADGMLLRKNITGAVDLMFIPNYDKDKFSVPSGVTNLRSEVFKGLTVTEIVIPASVRTIEDSAFKGCNSLTKVTFENGPDSLTMNIGAFNGCANITELVLPGRLAGMGTDSDVVTWLKGFRYLKKITVDGGDNSTAYASDENGMLFNGAKDKLIFCPRASELTTYVVPSTVLHIADGAFAAVSVNGSWESRKLTSITFHNQMRSIGAQAFYRNTKLKTVTFAASATRGKGLTIGEEAFYGCSGVTTLDFQETGALNAQNVYVATATCDVTEIGNSAFYGVRATSVTLPSTLTSIGDSAFSSNNMLENLDLGHIKTDLKFGNSVFGGNTKLTKVEITANIGVLEFQNVFRGCNITEYDVSKNPNYSVDNVKDAQGNVTGCVIYDKNYTKIVYINNVDMSQYRLPGTITEISGSLFSGRTDITKFTVPAAVTSIGAYAFQNCINLEEIIFEAGTANLTIGANAFSGCSKLTEITIPGRTMSMGASLFTGTGITTVTFEEGVTEIPHHIFQNVTSLKTINLPRTLKTVGEYAFAGSGVETVTFTPPAAGKTPVSLEIKDHAFAGCASLVSIVLPEGLQYVSESMFENCAALESVTIPTTVKNTSASAGIGKSAFYNCGELSEIKFTEGGTDGVSFGEFSLYNTMKLTTIDIPTRAAALGNSTNVFALSSKTGYTDQIGAFDTNANGVYLPKSALQTITMGGQANGNGTYFSTYDGVLYSANHETLLLCPKDYAKETLEVSKYAKSFGTGAFRDVTAVTHIVFQAADDLYDDDGVTKLPDFVISSTTSNSKSAILYGCKSVTSIAFPARLTEIGAYAFWKTAGATNNSYSYLTEVTFAPNCQLTEIGACAFLYSGISSLELPNKLQVIGGRAFQGSSSLTAINWPSNLKKIESDPATSGTRYGAFEGTGLSGALNLPDTLEYIGDYAFKGLSGITSIHIPELADENKTVTLGINVFKGTGISEVTLSSKLQLDSNVKLFEGCNSLTKITFDGDISDYMLIINALNGARAGVEIDFINTTDANTLEYDNGILYAKPSETTRSIVFCSKNMESYLENGALTIAANVVEIVASAFYGVTGIDTIVFEASEAALTVGTGAFSGVSATSIDLSNRTLTNNTLGDGAFQNCTALEWVKLPATLTILPQNSFRECAALNTVSFGGNNSSLTTIGFCAFYNCTSFTGTSETEFVLPAGVTSFGNYAFSNCTSLENFVLPATDNTNLKVISDYMFDGCTGLRFIGKVSSGEGDTVIKTYGLPSKLTTIGLAAFRNCYLLGNYIEEVDGDGNKTYSNTTESLITTSSTAITAIWQYAFKNCRSLVNINIPNSVAAASFGKASSANVTATTDVQVFYGCTSLETVTFVATSKITIIGMNAFKDCTHLKTVAIPGTVTTIGESAFENCGSALPAGQTLSVTFTGTKLTTIAKAAFKDSGLGTITLPSSMKNLGSTSTATEATLAQVFAGCTRLTTVNMSACSQSTMTVIGQEMFSGCTNLTSVSFNAKIKTIAAYAFENCVELSDITFTNSTALTIKSYAFAGCSNLETVNLHGTNGVTFEINAFSNGESGESQKGCPKLATIDFGETAATKSVVVNEGAFNGCAATGVTFGGFMLNTADGGLYAKDASGNPEIFVGYNGGAVDTFTIAEGVTTINAEALKGNTLIKNLIIPASVTSVGKSAFEDSSIQTVTFGHVAEGNEIPESAATTIGETAFKNAASLTTVNFNGVVTTIDKNAFNGASSLVSIDLDGVTSIGQYAFANTGRLHAESGKLVVPESVTKIDSYAFNASNVVNIEINANCGAAISGHTNCVKWFLDCKNLGTVTLGGSLTAIGAECFSGCNDFTLKLDMASVTYFDYETFKNCPNIMFQFGDNSVLELIEDGNMLVTNDNSKTLYYVFSIPADGKLTIPAGVKNIANQVFNSNTALTELTLSSTIDSVGEMSFYSCTNLKTIVNMENIIKYGSRSFEKAGLTSVTLNDNAVLDGNAFNSCTTIEGKVTIGSGVTFIATNTTYKGQQFKGCTKIEEVEINASLENDYEFAKSMFESCSGIKKATINCVVIADSMFKSCTGLLTDSTKQDAIWLNNATTLMSNAFNSCFNAATAAGNVYLPKVSSFGSTVFSHTGTTTNVDVYVNGKIQEETTAAPWANNANLWKHIYIVGVSAQPEEWKFTASNMAGNVHYVSDGNTIDGWPKTTTTPETPEENTEA